MKTKFCICSQLNYLLFRTAIEAKILFAVCLIKKQALTGEKSLACEDKCSKKIGAVLVQQADRRSFEASAVLNFVFFIMLKNKIEQSAKRNSLLKKPTDRTFGNRRNRYKELGKKVPQAYRVYVEDTFLPCDAGDVRIFSKEETGLYYYGARYLDPKYSRRLSGDPALNDYIPKAPIDDKAKKDNENLPGMGGVFNVVNLHVYHYAGNNPIKYVDPDGEFMLLVGGIGTYGGGTGGSITVGIYFITSSDGNSARIGLYRMSEIGSFFGGGLGGGTNITMAPFATKFSDIEGSGTTLGGSLSTPIVFALFKKVCPPSLSKTSTGLEFGFNPYAKDLSAKIKSFNISVSLVRGAKWSTPGEGHLFYSYTEELTGKDIDKVIQTIEEYWSSGKYNELIEYLKSFLMPKNKNMEAE